MFEPIEVMAYHKKDGTIEPLRFKFDNKEYLCGDLLSVKENNFAGNPTIIYRFHKSNKEYELLFEKNTGKWFVKR